MFLQVKVLSGSGKPEFSGEILIVHTTEKLEKGQANRDVVRQVAKFYKVSTNSVRISKGLKSRNKLLEIIESGPKPG